jgi:hypothetical protein
MKSNIFLTFDTEYGLGHLADGEMEFPYEFAKTTRSISSILKLLEEFNFPVTWALVGKLIEGDSTILPIEEFYPMDRISEEYLNKNRDQYFSDLLVSRITCSRVKHEIASHTYSHIIFSKGRRKTWANINTATLDFVSNSKVFLSHGIIPKSFVYPQNRPGFTSLLSDFGFEVYRGEELKWSYLLARKGSLMAKVLNIIEFYSPLPPRVSRARKRDNCIELNGHLHLALLPFGAKRLGSEMLLLYKIYTGTILAILTRRDFHLWTHPYDFNYRLDSHLYILRKTLRFLRFMEKKGLLKISTMSDASILRSVL